MRALFVKGVIPPLLAAPLVWLLLTGVAQAQGPADTTLTLRLPDDGAVGQELTLEARLTDGAGAIVVGAEIAFLREVEFMNAGSELPLGQAITDDQGIATLSFVPRSEGEILITARFEGNDRYSPTSVSDMAPIQTGPALYVEEAGVDVPGINVSFLVGILGGVWATYFVVITLLWLIVRKGVKPPPFLGGVRE
ncbi:MAG: hypothetical protein V3U26_02660 [Dehalococcoidia bacterium]